MALAHCLTNQYGADQMMPMMQRNPTLAAELDESIRPGAKQYPRWKDALLGNFKQGRHKHLGKTGSKSGNMLEYCLKEEKIPKEDMAQVQQLLKILQEHEAPEDIAKGVQQKALCTDEQGKRKAAGKLLPGIAEQHSDEQRGKKRRLT